ncbi:DUF1761 domain-containing protein [Sphingomonas sp. G-3-2-10]|uniref:DUF1761 domain-containing protein n=1 Tax=Sphingomonas sp. G-3-2-10 TaxID=2728838 RepID=UPI00146ED1A8|nr:DUF1761 domain-containing protein [Sphingomonas sp. G-3-2-10]NML07274.1 DUF1761 domain-containing protein [Sphingomonas sp. G-3-2-10]
MPDVNWLAVLAATLASFVLGGLWYSPVLFGKKWQAAAGLSDETLKAGNPAIIFGGSFVLAAIASAMFAMFIGPMTAGPATAAGFSAGLCWVATSFGINGLFERKPIALTLINGGYHTVQFTLIGAILGVWH